jgi:dihydroorotase
MAQFNRRHLEFIAEYVAPLINTPQDIEYLADVFEDTNPLFKRGKFVSKAINAWEKRNLIDDEIPY